MIESGYSPAPFADVRVVGPFWRERLEVVLSRTIPSQHAKLAETGILESLKLPKPVPPLTIPRNAHGFTMQVFWDSDVGKWIEAASYALSHRRDAAIEAKIDAIVDDLAKAQSADGYLNCWYNGREPEKRWTICAITMNSTTPATCSKAPSLTTARRAGGGFSRSWSDTSITWPRHSDRNRTEARLPRASGNRACARQALPSDRGPPPPRSCVLLYRRARTGAALFHHGGAGARRRPVRLLGEDFEYSQSHRPVREQTQIVGHAVRGMYMASAMADLAFELGDASLKTACETLWRDVTTTQMYVTAGLDGVVERGIHKALRSAQRNRLCRNLCLRRPRLLGSSDVAPRPRRDLR